MNRNPKDRGKKIVVTTRDLDDVAMEWRFKKSVEAFNFVKDVLLKIKCAHISFDDDTPSMLIQKSDKK